MGERRGMKALELWCKKITDGYAGVKVENMTTSWRDGLAFCALIHHFRPDLIDFPSLEKGDVYANNELAFRVAERHLGIPALLDAEDMALYEVPDRLSILTYLSQFYQVFASQGSSPVKRSPEPAERSMVLGSSVQSAPTKELSCALRRREPCKVCGQPVFLAQRLLVGTGQLYHRTCFRCARCSAQLSLANCYETMDGQHCCETCPDEEEEDRINCSGDHELKDNNLKKNLSVEDNSVSQLDTAIDKPELKPASLVVARKLMFENSKQVTLGCELTDDDKVINKTRKGSLDRFRSTSDKLKTDAALDIKCAQLAKPANSDNAKDVLVRLGNVRLGKDDKLSDFGFKNRNSLEIKSDFGCKTPKSLEIGGSKNRKSLEIPSDFGCKNPEIGVVSDIGKAKEVHHDSIPFIDSVEDMSVNFEKDSNTVSTSADVSESHPNVVVVSPVVDELLDDSDCKLKVVSVDLDQGKSDKCDVDLPLELSPSSEEGVVESKLDIHQDTYLIMKPLTPEPEELIQEPIYEEISGDLKVHKGKEVMVVECGDVSEDCNDDFNVKELKNECEAKIGDAIAEIGANPDHVIAESEGKLAVDTKIEEQSVVEVITPPKRNRKTPLVVDRKQETEFLKRVSTGSAKEQNVVNYPSELNPFGDDDEEEEGANVEKKKVGNMEDSEVPAKRVSTSLNPFGSDDEDEEEEIVVPKPVERKKKHSPAPSTNPFESDEDEEEEQSEATSLLQPVPLPRKLKSPPLSPTPKPRSFHSRTSSMSSSIGVPVSPSPRKKKPAPPPPPLTPKQKKTRPPPPPPKMPTPDSRSVSPTPSNLDAISLNSTYSSPDVQEKSFKDASNRQKQSGVDNTYVPHKSVYGTWKRKKAPAPLPPIAQRRPVKPMPIKQLRQELKDIEIKQQGLERQGVTLEQTIREKFDLETSMTPYVEELILQLFELVNEKNELFRRQAELMYLRRQHHLEEEHAELEYQIRCLMLCPEQNKTDSDKEREEELIQRLVDIVERRNEIVQCLEMDRLREAEEDRSVNAQLNTLSAVAMGFDAESDRTTTLDKKGDKKSKKEKKKGKIDIDKDIDESEKQKKKSKKKWFTLQHSPKRL